MMKCSHSYARDCSECCEPVCKRYLDDLEEQLYNDDVEEPFEYDCE